MTLEELKKIHGLGDQQVFQLESYMHYLIEQNKLKNLTAITDATEIVEKHFHDSLLIAPYCQKGATFCDVGSGAGFPGLVLAIVKPECHFTLVEPTKKRCAFLNETIAMIGLKNVDVINQRAEDYANQQRESFDLVSARAVANLVMLSELCLPLVKVGGLFISMKAQKGLTELDEAKYAIKTLGGSLAKIDKKMLRDGSLRYNIVIRKEKTTNKKYPRMFSQIKKKPLINKKGG